MTGDHDTCTTASPHPTAHQHEPLRIRAACAEDREAIERLVRAEHMNPNDLNWSRFIVATINDTVVGAVQMRHHPDGSRELGSLVVRRDQRRRGLAGRLISQLLEIHPYAPVHVITRRTLAHHYRLWGFELITRSQAPRVIRRQQLLGQVFGGLAKLRQGRLPSRLAILRRT